MMRAMKEKRDANNPPSTLLITTKIEGSEKSIQIRKVHKDEQRFRLLDSEPNKQCPRGKEKEKIINCVYGSKTKLHSNRRSKQNFS